MKKHIALFAPAAIGAALLAALPSFADETKPPRTPLEFVAAATPDEWTAISAKDLLVMDLAPDAKGKARRVIIQLIPAPFSQGWVGNIRKLATAHWWDGTAVVRVQDNYVTQWGDPTEKKALPDGLVTVPESEYVYPKTLQRPRGLDPLFIPPNDVSRWTSFYGGFPVAGVGTPDSERNWPIHCYGMVGVGRDLSPNTGTGAELYTVIGHAPRQLDRNIALVGRVIEGMENLSSLPRGTGNLGFYEKEEERVPITSVRLASELPKSTRPVFEYLSPESKSFAAYAYSRANRKDDFYNIPAGGVDICNLPVPIRSKPK